MIVAVRTLFQRSKELGKQWLAQPGLRLGAQALGLAGGGFLASAASLRGTPQPLAMGLILRFGSWRSLCVSLGSLVGYRFFWGDAAEPALWWVLGAGILALLGLPEKVLPMLGLLVVGIAGVCLPWERSVAVLLLRLGVAGGSIWIFGRKDRLGRWLQCAAASLALAQAAPMPWLGLGYAAAGALAVGASFPAAALAGLGLDLAHITRLPMTAVVTLGWMGRLLPRGKRYRWSFPAGAALVAMVAMDLWDWRVLPGLALGGAIGLLLPAPTTGTVRAGATGPAAPGPAEPGHGKRAAAAHRPGGPAPAGQEQGLRRLPRQEELPGAVPADGDGFGGRPPFSLPQARPPPAGAGALPGTAAAAAVRPPPPGGI